MKMTNYANVRSKQRGIPPLIVEWLEEYGAVTYDHHGGQKKFFDKRSRKLLSKRYGKEVVDRMGSLMNTYLVVESGHIITVAHRQKHINRN
ncbi:MAG: hypothetical protein ACE5HI_15845 [bacterium]